ncbi:zinc-dependent alcohol dehydrogenase family protein [Vibrio rhodolitus]|uniref:zinc-dependent alcohol dehydrogenase family protein n=1 Tax=Vibrio rhodolitus TaxID=2231649 RepID=UPI000E09FF9A|nr:zinc-dependent alcohol dehydrogenase family protein [Vibrio rhodolitus]
MKAMVLNQYGDEAQFELAEIKTPDVSSGQVLIQVAASSVNTVDTMIKQLGENLPFSPQLPALLGMDVAGTVAAVADDVTNFKVGDEVYGCAGGLASLSGSLADFMPADTRLIAHKPKNLSMAQAAALPLVGITAFEGLHRAGIAQGQKVLVHGGAGGVGHIAVQLARYFGADVYTTIGRDEHVALVENLGATAINYRSSAVEEYVDQYTGGEGFDVIFDSVGGANMSNSFLAAKLNGQIASTVALLEMDLSLVHMKGLSLHIVFMLIQMIHNVRREEHAHILTELAKIAEAGHLTPILDDSNYTLEQVNQAYARLSSGQATGKVVIIND